MLTITVHRGIQGIAGYASLLREWIPGWVKLRDGVTVIKKVKNRKNKKNKKFENKIVQLKLDATTPDPLATGAFFSLLTFCILCAMEPKNSPLSIVQCYTHCTYLRTPNVCPSIMRMRDLSTTVEKLVAGRSKGTMKIPGASIIARKKFTC